jgi:hypothetical protein
MESGDQVQITGTRSIALTVSLVFLTPSYVERRNPGLQSAQCLDENGEARPCRLGNA